MYHLYIVIKYMPSRGFFGLLKFYLKLLCLYLFSQNCLHLTLLNLTIFLNNETYSRKYEKLLKSLSMHVKNIIENMNLLKMCGPQIRILFIYVSTHCVETVKKLFQVLRDHALYVVYTKKRVTITR